MERRGMTLIEVLAVVAILAVLGALALPAVESRIDSARFDAAGREVEAAVVMARAEAQRRGAVVSLVARGMGNGETGLFEEVMSDGAARRESLDNGTSEAGATATERDSAHGDGSAPVVILESGVRVTATLDTGTEATGDLTVKSARMRTGEL